VREEEAPGDEQAWQIQIILNLILDFLILYSLHSSNNIWKGANMLPGHKSFAHIQAERRGWCAPIWPPVIVSHHGLSLSLPSVLKSTRHTPKLRGKWK
jgi:hypothetical protein